MTPVLEIEGLQKNYAGLRPLRIKALQVAPAERVAVQGFDAATAELMVNLVTGATLPEAGVVRTFGKDTAEIADGDEWLASLDRFGIVSDRAVLLEGSTLVQNLALPFTLDIDPIAPDMLATVTALAEECGIAGEWLTQPAGSVPPENPRAWAPRPRGCDGAAAPGARASDSLGGGSGPRRARGRHGTRL